MKYLNEYNSIMSRYKSGEFGNESLSLHDIFEKANNPGLIDKMDLSEIQCLLGSSSGITRKLFSLIKQKLTARIINMSNLEDELARFNIDSFRDGAIESDEALATKLKLAVQYCADDELPIDTEAMLCPINDEKYLGVIKILKDCATSDFSFRHEIIHYFRDVKVGNRVTSEFARSTKGNTPSEDEQEINYLTAASIMPMKEIQKNLYAFENAISKEAENAFLSELAKQYEQDEDAILRRLIEVRSLVDYAGTVKA